MLQLASHLLAAVVGRRIGLDGAANMSDADIFAERAGGELVLELFIALVNTTILNIQKQGAYHLVDLLQRPSLSLGKENKRWMKEEWKHVAERRVDMTRKL